MEAKKNLMNDMFTGKVITRIPKDKKKSDQSESRGIEKREMLAEMGLWFLIDDHSNKMIDKYWSYKNIFQLDIFLTGIVMGGNINVKNEKIKA